MDARRAEAGSPESFRSRVLLSYLWNFAGEGGVFLVVLATESLRAHLISPEEIGLVVAALWLVGLMQVVGELGLGAALVQDRELTARQATAIGDAILAISAASALLSALAAPLLAAWYRNPDVVWIGVALAPMLLIQGSAIPHRSALVKALRFGALARATLLGSLATLATLAPLALAGFEAWAIVAAMLVGSAVQLVCVRATSGWRAERPADRSRLRTAVGFGAHVSASNVLFYAYTNADYLLLGRFWPERTLALYFNAFRLAELPGSRIVNPFNRVSFPAFSLLASAPERLRAHYLETTRNIAIASFPIALGLAAVAPDAVLALYGPNWVESIPVVRLLALAFLTRSVVVVGPAALLALGQARANLYLSVLYAVTLIPAIVIGAWSGPLGVAWAWVVVSVPLNLGIVAWAAARVGLRPIEIGRALLPAAIRALGMAGGVAGVAAALPQSGAGGEVAWAWVRLSIEVAIGALLYATWTLLAERDLRRFLIRRLRPGS